MLLVELQSAWPLTFSVNGFVPMNVDMGMVWDLWSSVRPWNISSTLQTLSSAATKPALAGRQQPPDRRVLGLG